MPTSSMTIKFDSPEKSSLYKEVLKHIINEIPKIRTKAQALEYVFESYLFEIINPTFQKNLIRKKEIERIRSWEKLNTTRIIKQEQEKTAHEIKTMKNTLKANAKQKARLNVKVLGIINLLRSWEIS